MLIRTLPTRLVPPLAFFKLALGLVAFWATWGTPATADPHFPYSLHALLSTAFGGTGALLLIGGRKDRRAVNLGAFFLAASTAWCNRPLRLFTAGETGPSLFSIADALELDAFMAFFLWRFARDFPVPAATLAGHRRVRRLIGVCAAAGTLLFVLNLLGYVSNFASAGSGLQKALAWFTPKRGEGIYYGVVLPLTAAAFPFLLWKARFAPREDQRRTRLFLQTFVLSFGPMIVGILLELFVRQYRDLSVTHPHLKGQIILGALLPALTLPFTVPYAVLKHRVLDVRLIARRALQYTLARYTALALVAVPLAALAVYLYAKRDQALDQVFSGGRVPLLLSIIAVGIAALRYRRPLLDAVDRRFFREQYDARQILTRLVDRIRSIQETSSLASLVAREIDLALHLEGAALLVLDPRSGMFADPRSRTRKLDASSQLAQLISNASAPLEVDLENPHSPLLKLPEKERRWLAETGFRLIVPIVARDGSLLGFLALGEKKSRLPFLKEDRQLLHAIASNAAWVLELEQERTLTSVSHGSTRDPMEPEDPTPSILPGAATAAAEVARECPKCGALHPSFTVFCGTCSKRLEPSRVPYVLPGKFRFEHRIGVGGMGVVYSGTDLALGRHVAIKTLRQVSPEDAMRLRREARTAAAVSHPHLAPIYGMETWKGVPMLVMELLEGGTLSHRAGRGALGARETVDLGVAMAGALAQLHAADILHRDIKPSNIGYTKDGTPKLMDFGIARVMLEMRREDELSDLEGEDEEEGDEPDLIPAAAVWIDGEAPHLPPRRRFAGTLSYLSPEALQGEPADETFDLWSLAVVLYECLLGRKVFAGTDAQIVERIQSGRVPDFSQVCPEHPEALGRFFRDALHRLPDRRPATAVDLKKRLEEVRREI